jgi:hypothetical protein
MLHSLNTCCAKEYPWSYIENTYIYVCCNWKSVNEWVCYWRFLILELFWCLGWKQRNHNQLLGRKWNGASFSTEAYCWQVYMTFMVVNVENALIICHISMFCIVFRKCRRAISLYQIRSILVPYTTCSDHLRPLDVGVYGPIKRIFISAVDLWMGRPSEARTASYSVPEIVATALREIATPKISYQDFLLLEFGHSIRMCLK